MTGFKLAQVFLAIRRNPKAAAAALLLLAVIWLGWKSYDAIYDRGYQACQAQNEKAVSKAREKASKDKAVIEGAGKDSAAEIQKLEKDLNDALSKLKNAGNPCIVPRSHYDGLLRP